MSSVFTVGSQSIKLEHIIGEVLSYHKHSESHVYGNGGGHNNSPVRIKTQEVTRTEFFIKDQSGNEHEVRLTDEKYVALRQGQKVTLVKAVQEDSRFYWVYLWVHNTDMEYMLKERYEVYSNKTFWHYPLLLLTILFFKYYIDISGWILPSILGVISSLTIATIIIGIILKPIAIKKLDKYLMEYVDRLG